MREISLKEMQQLELNLLLELDKVCKAYNLRYYLDGGTLLGAMCYEGFIPWDDDIDLKMPRPDYERLLTLQSSFPDYIRLDAPSPEHCEYTMLKLVDDRTLLKEHTETGEKTTGVYIDVFPMDGHPAGKAFAPHLRKLCRYNSLFHHSLNGFKAMKESASLKSRLKGRVYSRLYTPWKLYEKLMETAKRYPYDSCVQVGLLVEGDAIRERFERIWLDLPVQLEFEGHYFPAASEYKKHMVTFYGEHVAKPECYHNLPQYPGNHNHEVWWKDSEE